MDTKRNYSCKAFHVYVQLRTAYLIYFVLKEKPFQIQVLHPIELRLESTLLSIFNSDDKKNENLTKYL